MSDFGDSSDILIPLRSILKLIIEMKISSKENQKTPRPSRTSFSTGTETPDFVRPLPTLKYPGFSAWSEENVTPMDVEDESFFAR